MWNRWDTHIFIIYLVVLIIYFGWSDILLYYKIQSEPWRLLTTIAYKNDSKIPSEGSANGHKSKTLEPLGFDPYYPISIKLISVDHLNHYVLYPLTGFLEQRINISFNMPFITADMISFSHILVAAAGSKLLLSDSLTWRRVGIILFDFRSLLDSYDGHLARSRRRESAMVQDAKDWGFFLDGICDGAATTFAMIAFLLIIGKARPAGKVTIKEPTPLFRMRNMIFGRKSQQKDPEMDLMMDEKREGSSCSKQYTLTISQAWATVLSLSGQQLLSSVGWNRYMLNCNKLLEVPLSRGGFTLQAYQTKMVQSTRIWLTSWFWKILNPHAMLNFYLYTMFFEIHLPTMQYLRVLGVIPILGLIFASEANVQGIMWNMWFQLQK